MPYVYRLCDATWQRHQGTFLWLVEKFLCILKSTFDFNKALGVTVFGPAGEKSARF
jgi:hypothetical protein